MTSTTVTPQPPLRRDRPFLLFLAARTVSVAGYAVTSVALPMLVLSLTGSALATAAVTALNVAPYLAFGLVAGAVADRVDRRRLMVACDLVACLALATVPLASAAGVLTAPHVLAVAAVAATCFVWFDAAAFGTLPVLVGRPRLAGANTALFTSSTLVDVTFPAVAGLLIATVGPAQVLGVDAFSYLISAALLTRLPSALRRPPRDDMSAPASHPGGMGAQIREGLTFVRAHPVVGPLTLLGFGNSLAAGAVTGLLVVYAVQALGLTTTDPRIALLYSAGAVGGVLAALVLPRLTRRLPVGWITIGALTCAAPLITALALSPSLTVALPLYAAWAATSTLVVVNGITARQHLTPDHLQSRVNTTARMIAWGGTPVGALLAGGLAQLTTVRTTYLVAASLAALTATAAWAGPLRHARRPSGPPGRAAGREDPPMTHPAPEHGDHHHGHRHDPVSADRHPAVHSAPVTAAEWDQRYAGTEQVWSGRPNGALVVEVSHLTPGRALDVGCGEGADAVWLARRGWEVTALDVSGVALERAARHAQDQKVDVRWFRSGLVEADLPVGGFDLVSAQYPALPRDPARRAERALLRAVAPGGVLLVVHHADVDADHARESGFDPDHYVMPRNVAELLDDDWVVDCHDRRARHVTGGAGAHHTHDVVLRARRLR